MKTFLTLLAVASLLPGQSFFNMHGLGELIYHSNAQSVALASPLALSVSNPGALVVLPQTRLNFTTLGTITLAQHNSLSRTVGSVRPAGVWGATPLPHGLRLSLSTSERFNQDFDVWTESSLASPHWYHIVSRGGIYALDVGLTASFWNHLGAGIGYNHVVGGSRENWSFITGDNRYRSTDTIELDWSGATVLGGISFQHQLFTVAALFEPSHELQARRLKRVHGATSDTEQVFSIRLPSTLSLGAGFRVHPRSRLQLGAERRAWARTLLNQAIWGHLRDVWRLSVGLEIELVEAHPLRIGYAYGDWYCWNQHPFSSERRPITENSLHLGTSLPIRSFGSIEFAMAIALRESQTPSGYLHENAFRLNLTLAYSEAWMRRTRRWGY